MTTTNWLPKVLRWMFLVFSIFCAAGAVALIAVLVIDPRIPADAHFGPLAGHVGNYPVTVSLRNAVFTLSALRGALVLTVDNAHGLVDVLKHNGLPILILNALFYTALFDLLRRLFRNVSKGESFTHANLRLVQSIGVSLLVFSLVAALAEGWFHFALFSYLSQHAWLTISGTTIHFPQQAEFTISGHGGHFSGSAGFSGDNGFPFGTPIFFTGLLVLALSEVFRQGLALKSEHDLTV